MIVGSIVLAGGDSQRMGYPKAWLPFGPVPVLNRIVTLLLRFTNPVVVVRSRASQVLPPLSPEIPIVEDAVPDRGPLEGIAAGMREIAPHCDVVFITSCDAPFLTGRYIEWLADQLGDAEIAVPFVGDTQQTLAALYRLSVLPKIEAMLQKGDLKPANLFAQVKMRKLDSEAVCAADPDLRVLRTMNTPEEYRAALETAGLPVTPIPSRPPG